jgi:ATP synthase protein I
MTAQAEDPAPGRAPGPSGSQLEQRVRRGAERLARAERDRHTVLGQTMYLGSLGLVFVAPVVLGAYLGRWLDQMAEGYSMRWTLSLLFAGLVFGAVNVYLMVRE